MMTMMMMTMIMMMMVVLVMMQTISSPSFSAKSIMQKVIKKKKRKNGGLQVAQNSCQPPFICLFIFLLIYFGKGKRRDSLQSSNDDNCISIHIFHTISQGNYWRVLYQSRALLVDPNVLFSMNTLRRSLMLVTFGVLGLVKYDQEVMGLRYESLITLKLPSSICKFSPLAAAYFLVSQLQEFSVRSRYTVTTSM